eukprot:TRINITY_DN4373_c0_g1_i4.p1 TRINITY_DN4373_c0_g1~~TRINITY_DN4373_c0_g1_i4.p1  ORF type:complete len:447 (-),score=23.48 TRINITY_DN4373_c0_g1_i4:629-1969(-)
MQHSQGQRGCSNKKISFIDNLSPFLGSPLDRAMGALFGAFIGDCMGATLEFSDMNEGLMAKAMKMEGEGFAELIPGQITDDSELALCLARGLVAGDGALNGGKIVREYCKWMKSPPFDLGNTIGAALRPLLGIKNEDTVDDEILMNTLDRNPAKMGSSESNGGLMRSTPLAVWCHRLASNEDVLKVCQKEQGMTHPHPIAHLATASYVIAIKTLISSNGDRTKARASALDFLLSQKDKSTSYAQHVEKMFGWLEEIRDIGPGAATHHIGWLKFGWAFSMLALKTPQEVDYKHFIEKVLRAGGDTDTNACIVGGVLGAYLGLSRLPQEYVRILLLCNPARNKAQKRDHSFAAVNIVSLGLRLFTISPKTLERVINAKKSNSIFWHCMKIALVVGVFCLPTLYVLLKRQYKKNIHITQYNSQLNNKWLITDISRVSAQPFTSSLYFLH